MRPLLPFLILLLYTTSCNYFNYDPTVNTQSVDGLKPIYISDDSWKMITFNATTPPLVNLGKFYYKDDYLYVTQRDAGIHIIDNSNPQNPVPVQFIEIKGATDIAIKGDILYVDNLSDLVAINIADFSNMYVEKRVEDLYPLSEQLFPENYSGYFECVDSEKGIVVGWEEATLENPTCSR